MNQKKKLSTKLIILIPVFILGIFSIISNVMSVSNIRNVNRSAVQISEVSLKNVSGLAEIQKQTQDIHNLGLSHIIAVDLDSMIQLVEKIRASVPDIAITTDIIVGFPGETEEEFAVTKEYLKRIHFYEMHIFQYSKREGTKAAVMEHQVPEPVKKERSNILLALEKKMSEEFRNYYVGKEKTALLEEELVVDGKTYFTGYTKEYVKIAVKSAADLSNQFVKGTIRGRLTDDIYLMVEF